MDQLSTPSEVVTGVALLLTSSEAEHYLTTGELPVDFVSRVDAFVRYATCTNCDDQLDMNVVNHDHHSATPLWCPDCCENSAANAFERLVGRPLAADDPRVTFTPEHAWRREDPLTLNEALTYLESGELPDDFRDRVALVEEFGADEADEHLTGVVVAR